MRKRKIGIGAATLICAAGMTSAVHAEETAATAAELIELLRARGIEVPGTTVNDDGSVTFADPAGDDSGGTEPTGDAAQAQSTAEVAASPEATAETTPPEPAAEWNSSVNVGLGLSSGNSENANFVAEFETQRTSKKWELTYDLGYYYAENDSEETENRLTTGLNIDRFLEPTRWLLFGNARIDIDEFQDWEWRLNFNAGAGYKVIREGDLKLTLRAGLGAFREFGGGSRELEPEAVLGADLKWQIKDNQSFTASARVFPSLEEGGEYRARNTADYKVEIDRDNGLSLVFSLIHEYQSDVDPGTDENDFKLFAGLNYDF